MIQDSKFEDTLNQLMQGRDIAVQGPTAQAEIEQILRNAMRESRTPPRVFIPLIRRLMGIPGWKAWLNYETLVQFVIARTEVVQIIAQLPITEELDPVADYMVGMAFVYQLIAQSHR